MSENQAITISAFAPANCPVDRLLAFKQMVMKGGEVNRQTLPGLIDRALVLAFVHSAEVLGGVGAIKRPYDDYRSSVFARASTTLNPSDFDFELGWIYVDPAFRGRRLSSHLLEKLIPYRSNAAVYATSNVDNEPMHASLRRVGFKPEGVPYPSKINDPLIQLFVVKQDLV